MRRLAVWLVWIAAVCAVVVAIGMRVRLARHEDPRQVLNAWLWEVPREVALMGTVVARDGHHLQVELRVDQVWMRRFAERNRARLIDQPLGGMVADRWIVDDGRQPGAIIHLMMPRGGPALVTVTWP